MPYSIVYRPAADGDITRAFRWYTARDEALGIAFLDEVERIEKILDARPFLYQRIEDDIRRASLRRFPYALYYIIEESRIVALACLHQHQKPLTQEELQDRQ